MTAAIEVSVVPSVRDLGDGFTVRRVLPSLPRRAVGPFVFFDQMGPVQFEREHGLDVRPHPHIGLATVTYLFEGDIVHRDSLGSDQVIRPGEVNWMVAGRGIVHSERTGASDRQASNSLAGIQTWVALPRADEECAPSFVHHARAALPEMEAEGVFIRVIAGSLFGQRAPDVIRSPLCYADLHLSAGARLAIPTDYEERALYLIDGEATADGTPVAPARLAVLKPNVALELHATTATRVLLIGGAPLDGPRHLYWNFVSSSRERIEQAKEDWRRGRFAGVPGDSEFIPLPSEPSAPSPL